MFSLVPSGEAGFEFRPASTSPRALLSTTTTAFVPRPSNLGRHLLVLSKNLSAAAHRVLRLLHDLGLDLSATCDAEEFGSAIFYSVYLGRVECLEVTKFPFLNGRMAYATEWRGNMKPEYKFRLIHRRRPDSER